MSQRLYTEYLKSNLIGKSTIRGYFLKKFRRYPLFALWKIGQKNLQISQMKIGELYEGRTETEKKEYGQIC